MKAKILIIDDDVVSWNWLSSVLRPRDYHTVWSADGMQAIGDVRKHQPQVILLDLGLPGGDGFTVLERLKCNIQLSKIPVIVVTVRAREEAEEKSLKLGAADYIEKPVKVEQLLAAVDRVLAPPDRLMKVG